jgi:hypothetical protein
MEPCKSWKINHFGNVWRCHISRRECPEVSIPLVEPSFPEKSINLIHRRARTLTTNPATSDEE